MLEVIHPSILLKGPCNYACYYCVGPDKKPNIDEKPRLHNLAVVRKHYEMFLVAAESTYTTFFMPGTEPLIHPQFPHLLEIALDAGRAMLRSNLSVPVAEWAPGKPEALTMQVTLHPQAAEDLAGFTTRVLEVMDMGIGIVIYYLDHPFQAHKVEEYRNHFASAKIPFKIQRHNQGKKMKHKPSAQQVKNTQPVQPKICTAGWKYIHIGLGSKLQRCQHLPAELERLLDGPTICQNPGSCPGQR